VIVLIALLTATTAVVAGLVRTPAAAVALTLVLLAGAVVAQARTAALERTALTEDVGRPVSGDATVLTAARADRFGGSRALVRWRGEPVLLRLPAWTGGARPEVGEIVRVRGKLRAPDLAARAVHAHATLRATAIDRTGRRRGGTPGAVDGIRRRAEAVLQRGIPAPEAALLRGMVLGEDDALPDDVREAFQAAGLTHLVAASGQNIMLLAALALGLAAIVGLGIRGRWLLVGALIALYVPLAGGGPSIQRAGVMGAASVAAVLAGRPASRWYALLLAAAVTLLVDPRSTGDAGWQLSFAAVLGIVLVAPATRRRLLRAGLPAPLGEAVAVTLAATLATAPLIAWRFDRFSLVALPANILATPAVAPVMWLGMVAAALGQVAPALAQPLVACAGLPLGFLVWLARWSAALPGADLNVPAAGIAALALVVAAVLVRTPARPPPGGGRGGRAGLRRRVGAAAALTAVAVALLAAVAARRPQAGAPAPPPPGDLRVTALDVGQGDATLVQAGDHALLVDAGPPGARVVAQLAAVGVRHLDALLVTHPQADHEGGAPAVLAGLPVGVLLDGRGGDRSPASVAVDAPLARRRTRVVPVHAGQELRAGALSLRVLWPPAGPPVAGADPNDRAVVAVASAYGRRVLLTADAESPVLAALGLGPVDVLKVSHHGSADAGLPRLLEQLRPRVALIEVGRRNTYGHPSPSTLQALRGVPGVYRTDRDGVIRVDLHERRATVSHAPAA
jgi:competence protein ComEC